MGVELVSNVCRHRQAVMLKGRGTLQGQPGAQNLVCPLHRWTYSGGQHGTPAGTLIGAPHFAQDPCLNLRNYPVRQWNGLLFEDNGRDIEADLAGMGPRADLDFTGMVLDHVELHECNYNWKTFIEVYLEDYHVGPFHPGLGHFVSCDDLRWEFKQHYSVQTVGVSNRLGDPARGSTSAGRRPAGLPWWPAARARSDLADLLPPHHGGVVPPCAHRVNPAPDRAEKTLNMVEFFYPEEVAAFEREFVEAQQAAYMETCIEDDEIGERMDAGRAQGPVPAWRQRNWPLPRAPWKTACSTSMSGTAQPWVFRQGPDKFLF
jgi:choline monooxygenase